jgi:hypothetical protein
MYGCRLDCCLVGVYEPNVLANELLLMSLSDICQDGREVCRRLVGVWDGRVEGGGIVAEHSCGNVRRLWLLVSVNVSSIKGTPYHSANALVERHGAVLAYGVEHVLHVREEWLHWNVDHGMVHD